MRRWFSLIKALPVPRDGETGNEGNNTSSGNNSSNSTNSNTNTGTGSEEGNEGSGEGTREDEEVKIPKQEAEFLSLLKNPNTSPIVLKQLADRMGLEIVEKGKGNKETTPKGPSMVQRLEQHLPEEWRFLAKSLAPVFEELHGNLQASQESLANSERNRVAIESKRAETQFYRDFQDAKKYERRIVQLMQSYPPAENSDMYEYLVDMYTIAKQRGGGLSSALTKKANERIDRNSTDGTTKSSSNTGSSQNVKVGSSSGKVSIREAVALAAQGKRVQQ